MFQGILLKKKKKVKFDKKIKEKFYFLGISTSTFQFWRVFYFKIH